MKVIKDILDNKFYVALNIIYVAIIIKYIQGLDKLNKALKSHIKDESFIYNIKVMAYNNGIAWKYLAGAFILIIIGIILLAFIILMREEMKLYIFISHISIIIISIIIIYIYINNPILRAAILVTLGSSAIFYIYTK